MIGRRLGGPWTGRLYMVLAMWLVCICGISAAQSEREGRLRALEMVAEAVRDGDDVAVGRIDEGYKALIEEAPDDVEARVSYAGWLSDSDRNAEAYGVLVAGGSSVTDSVDAQRLLAELALRLGLTQEAARALTRVVELAPDSPGDRFHLANVLFLFRNELVPEFGASASDVMDVALLQFKRASELAPHSAEMARAYAEVFYTLDPPLWNEALDAWESIRNTHPQEADLANTHIARIALKLGRTDVARKALESVKAQRFDALIRKLTAKLEEQEASAGD